MLSVVIVNWNTREFLRLCLNSISAHPGTHALEIIVVDNASTDGSADIVLEILPSAKLIRCERNTGYAGGNNIGIGHATGEYILTLNPDTELQPGTFDTALQVLLAQPKRGCVGIQLRGHQNEIQSSVRGFPTFWGIVGDVTKLGQVFPRSALNSYRLFGFDYEKDQVCAQPMGTFLLFRREALKEIGSDSAPFDEAFPIFFNEVDLLFRLKHAGWDCYFTAKTFIRHLGGASTRQVKKSMIWESHRSLVRYLRKHYGTGLSGFGVSIIALLILAAAFVRARGYDAGFRT